MMDNQRLDKMHEEYSVDLKQRMLNDGKYDEKLFAIRSAEMRLRLEEDKDFAENERRHEMMEDVRAWLDRSMTDADLLDAYNRQSGSHDFVPAAILERRDAIKEEMLKRLFEFMIKEKATREDTIYKGNDDDFTIKHH